MTSGFSTFRKVINRYAESGLRGVSRSALRYLAPEDAVSNEVAAPHPMVQALDWLSKQRSFSIVQIGAFVGDTPNDPLAMFFREQLVEERGDGIKVVLVEPVKEYFDRLCDNYKHLYDMRFENVAIAEREEIRDFYRLSADPVAHGYPDWLSQLSSLRSDRMTKLWDSYEKHEDLKKFYLSHRTTEKVRCITLQGLLEKHSIHALDLLQVDTEGYDYEILKTIDFGKTRPRFVNYERVLLQDDEVPCREMMQAAGYLLIDYSQDTFCVRIG
jgi:FkbM family methyltransferase